MPKHCDTLITSNLLITQDSRRCIVYDAGVAIGGGRISALGPAKEMRAGWSFDRHLDLGSSLVLPGLVNAHTHVAMTLFRGLADDMPLMQWLSEHIFPAEKKLTPEMTELGALLGCAEMLRTGTTCFCDMYLMESAVVRAAERAGLRARVGEVIFSFPGPVYADLEGALDVSRSLFQQCGNSSRVDMAVMPHAVYTTTPEILQKTYALAEELDVPWHIHLAESVTETAQCMDACGMRPVQYINSLGLCGPRTLAAHCVDLLPEETALLAETGVQVAHCPASNMKLASGVAPVPDMLLQGTGLGLGTDGAASSNNLSMFTTMGMAALFHKGFCKDSTVMPAQQVLDMATLGGAKCLHLPELGHLVPGGPADLIALTLDCASMQPLHNPVSQVVYAATGSEVFLTMVEGEVLYHNGQFTRFDYPALVKEIQDITRFIRKQA